MSNELDTFLDGANQDTTGEEARKAAEAQAVADQTASDKLAAEEAERAAAAKQEAEKVPMAALLAERQKRQQAEQRAAELEAARQQEEKPFLGEEYEQRFTETENKFSLALENQRITLSEEFARDKYADYDEKFEVFVKMATENPALVPQMRAQSNPAAFAYKAASNQLKLAEMANPDEYEAKLREKISKEIEEKYTKEAAKRGELPGTLATTRGVAGTQGAEWNGPPALSDILK